MLFVTSIILGIGIFNKWIVKCCFIVGFIAFILIFIISKQERKIIISSFNSYIIKSILLFLFVCLLSLIFSKNFSHSQEVFFQRYLPYFLLFFIGYYLGKDLRFIYILTNIFMIGGLLVSIGGVIDLMINWFYGRAATFYGKNVLWIEYLLFVLPLFITSSIFEQRLKIKLLAIIGLFFSSVCFFFSYSRGAWLSFILAAFILSIINKKSKKLFLTLFIATLFIILIIPSLRNRLLFGDSLNPVRWGDRIPMWGVAFYIFKEHPVLGIGLGNYEKNIYSYKTVHSFIEKNHLHAHNIYLELLAETGIFGFVSFLLIIFLFFKTAFANLKLFKNPFFFSFVFSLLAIFILNLSYSGILIGISMPALFWVIFGLSVSMIQ